MPVIARLEGAEIVSEDGRFLGRISRNPLDTDSIANTLGKYGSRLSSTSIFNRMGRYGGTSAASPFNTAAAAPPRIRTPEGEFIAYLTLNKAMEPRVDPHHLMSYLGVR